MSQGVLFIFVSVILLSSFEVGATDYFMGSPLDHLAESRSVVGEKYPDAKLMMIRTFVNDTADPQCSMLGWEFVYFPKGITSLTVRDKFRHVSDGVSCHYVRDSKHYLDKFDFDGYWPLNETVAGVKVGFTEAREAAIARVGLGFIPVWSFVATPLHPRTMGSVFYHFGGVMECGKKVVVLVNASSGEIFERFSEIPTCP